MRITKREIIVSVTIIAIMLLLGVVISGKISEAHMDSQEVYNKATKIDNMVLFRYGMDTSIGNAFVYGEFNTLDPVSFPEIGGDYLSIKKVKERYTSHTRTVTRTVDGKTTSHIETYWTWDRVSSEALTAKSINFCGVDFKYSQFNDVGENYIDTIKESLNIRYKYYGHLAKTKGTIFATLVDGDIGKDKATFYENKSIAEVQDYLDSDFMMIIFWLLWLALIGATTYGFFYFENTWLAT